MNYEIIVAKNKEYLFSTSPQSAQTIQEFRELFKVLDQRFPEQEGFSFAINYYAETVRRTTRAAVSKAIESNDIKELCRLFEE